MKQMSKKVVSAMEVVSDYVEKESLDEQVILSTKPLQSVKTAGDFIMSGSTLVKYQGNAAAAVSYTHLDVYKRQAFNVVDPTSIPNLYVMEILLTNTCAQSFSAVPVLRCPSYQAAHKRWREN